jgi:nitroreductase
MVDQVRLLPPAELDIPLGEAMFTQRAIRKLKPDPISDEQLKLVLDAASRAPSGGNFQPARFLVVRDQARILAFGELYREAWWAKRRDGPGWTTIQDIPKTEKGFLAAAQLAEEMGRAPVVILVFAAVRGDLGHSVLPAVQNLLLAARALGIGSTLTTLHDDVMPRVQEMFNVPDSAQFYCCIPLGYPRGRFGTTLRRATSDTTYWDTWTAPPPWR